MAIKFFYAKITSVEKNLSESGNTAQYKIFIKRVNSLGDWISSEALEALPPSSIPFSMSGGGMTTWPAVGNYCWVLQDESNAENKVQILTYAPYPSTSPQGIYTPELVEEGSIIYKIGGLQKSVFKMSPKGEILLYSDEFSHLKIYGNTSKVALGSKTFWLNYGGGYFKFDHLKESSLGNITPSRIVFSQEYENLVVSDRDFSTESYTKLALLDKANKYVSKAVISAGQILNTNLTGEQSRLSHLFELDTRQAINGDMKDTVTNLRVGYQKDSYLFDSTSKSAAGNIIYLSAKTVKPMPATTSYDSFVFRFGKIEGDSFNEKMSGEIFRNQIYSGVHENIGNYLTDPVGSSKGYGFEFVKKSATQQFIESFGELIAPSDSFLQNTFYRKSIHSYTSHSLATVASPTGLEYYEVYSNDKIFFDKKLSYLSAGQKDITLTEKFEKENSGTYSLRKEHATTNSHELVKFHKDFFQIEVTPDNQFIYEIKMTGKVLTITVKGKKTSFVKIEDGIITADAPDSVVVNTKTCTVTSTDKVTVKTKSADVQATDVVVTGKTVKFSGNSVEIDKIIPGATNGFCPPLCFVTGAPLSKKSVPT